MLLISSSLKFFRRTVLIFTSIFCFFASNRPSKTNFKFPPLVINWNFSGIKVSNEIFILSTPRFEISFAYFFNCVPLVVKSISFKNCLSF